MQSVKSQEGKAVHLFSIDLDVYMLNDDEEDLLGAFLDTEASMSLVGREQAK